MKIKLDLIQFLRGMMAIIVVLHHISGAMFFYLNKNWVYDIFSVGWFGVDFFFVLSGFIMVYAHKEDYILRTNVAKFFKKRFTRIYPTYWIIASISLPFFILSAKLSIDTDIYYIVKSFLLIPDSKAPFLGVAWSLVFECFFYLVFGFGIYFGLKIMKYVLFVWGAIIIISNLFFLPISNLFIFNNFILEFLFGCIIGYQFVFNSTKYNFKPEIMIYVGSFILLVMWLVSLNSDFGLKSAIESRLVYGLSASLIILGSAILNVQREIKIPKLLLLIGNSSYVLYLIHPIVLATAFKLSAPFLRFNESFISVFGLFVLVLSVAVGLLFHVIVEKKLIKKLNYLVFPNNKKPAYK